MLGAYSSALLLGVVALAIGAESLLRLANPREIDYQPALVVAVIGLVVNLVCAWLLHAPGAGHGHVMRTGTRHDHDHAQPAHHDHPAADLNLQGRPTCTCWPTPPPRCWPSWRCWPACTPAWAGSTR